MNVVKEIQRINERELDLKPGAGSWHDDYKDSAYIFVGGLDYQLTEGDVITIFSQYGEVADVDMPRDKNTGKRRGFAFLMYEDQRSTILAVDNLNGAQVLNRTLRVDHTKDYKQKELIDGKWVDRETERLNAKPELIQGDGDGNESEGSSVSSGFPDIDPDDPMRDYLIAQRKEQSLLEKSKKKKSKRHANETPEERRARKERKRQKKLLKEGEGRAPEGRRDRKGDAFDDRPRDRERDWDTRRQTPPMRTRSRSPPARGYERRRPRSREYRRDDYRSRP